MVNSPLPSDLGTECRRAAKTLNAFIDPEAKQGPDQLIPANIIEKALGLAVLTVVKAGFIFSGRLGSGLVIARLPDGKWSAPSAIGTGGVGVGGQVGGELTDFVIILNTKDAVKAFSLGGNVTLGGNLSVALGPVGRNAEAAAAVGHIAAIYSYSKTKGLFAGVSVEGSVIIERKDANEKFYGRRVGAKDLLSGVVPQPAEAEPLYEALSRRASRVDQVLSLEPSPAARAAAAASSHSSAGPSGGPPAMPARPPAKPKTAIALFDFPGQRSDDLSFRKGDIIVITHQTTSQNDWWEGESNGRRGTFPANYVKLD